MEIARFDKGESKGDANDEARENLLAAKKVRSEGARRWIEAREHGVYVVMVEEG